MSRGAILYRNLRAYQIYGANTGVGKTVFSTILCRALARAKPASPKAKENVWYLKPVSTGPSEEADQRHLTLFAPDTKAACLFQFAKPVSPHIAAVEHDGASAPPSDSALVESISQEVERYSKSGSGVAFVETAGGVHSPAPSGTSQADLYRPLRLPVHLVADSRLGGISSTISAFESLHLRGYDVESILIFRDETYQNHDYLAKYFSKRSIQTLSLPPPPSLRRDQAEDQEVMSRYYSDTSASDELQQFLAQSHDRHDARIERLGSMATRAHQSIWYPFTQHQNLEPENILTIDSAHGDFFQTLNRPVGSIEQSPPESEIPQNLITPTFDASASWWTQGLGHGSPDLALSAAHAAGRYGHVMFAGAVHEPALEITETLLANLKNPRLQRVFFSDDGSTGMEVAVKMALTASSTRYGWSRESGRDPKEVGILGLKGSYHGDTIGAMDCSEQSTFNDKVHWYHGRGHWLDFPQVKLKDGEWVVEAPASLQKISNSETFSSLADIFALTRDESGTRKKYESYIKETLRDLVQKEGKRFGALILEPIILGAGGMLFCDPLFQRTLVEVVRSSPEIFETNNTEATSTDELAWRGLPVIFDEVFTGLYRLGSFTPSSLLNTHPDISVHAKLLTGGLLPLCTTIASDSVYQAFLSDEKSDALLHGHSYTAHAIGCQVAQTSVQAMIDMDHGGSWDEYKRDWKVPGHSSSPENDIVQTKIWSVWGNDFVSRLSQAKDVESVITLGSVLAINLHAADNAGYNSAAGSNLQKQLLREVEAGFNIHSRVLGNVLYLMASQTSDVETLRKIERRLAAALSVE
ncbi:bifunctional dethiobiotin synthetase adenosylmethionine-8-amino-7-oxononanoate aminotransferase [Phlyctema vagabunda]|uniref:Bifunctional dethiobiotin synthetase adenosylmethionine-8-amino-7-oxononanoate aminotransferase n=1 Tax=Phlyctema vagabunda TaxID=108571 RepID=A0ABR4PW59_9HELO